MNSFISGEIKGAVLWMMNVLMLLLRWLFRWVLRLGMLALLFFCIGKGCWGISSRMQAHYAKSSLLPSSQSQVSNAQGTKESSALPESSESQRKTEVPVPQIPGRSTQSELRSGWVLLRGIAKDTERIFRKR